MRFQLRQTRTSQNSLNQSFALQLDAMATAVLSAPINGLANGDSAITKPMPKIKSKNQLRRAKEKLKKFASPKPSVRSATHQFDAPIDFIGILSKTTNNGDSTLVKESVSSGPNVEYVSEQLDLQDSVLEAFSDVFARFQLPPDENTVRFVSPLISCRHSEQSAHFIGQRLQACQRRGYLFRRRNGVRF